MWIVYIVREITAELKILAAEYPVVAIFGPRQSGKTSLAKHLFADYDYINLENPDLRDYAQQDPRGFLKKQMGRHTIFDEIQKTPQLPSYLQQIVDEDPTPGRYILTGSQNMLLHSQVSQSLAGRLGIATLLPLTVSELDAAGLMPPSFEAAAFHGGYPRIHEQALRPSGYYANYVDTHIQKDIRELVNVRDFDRFIRFLALLAGRSGQVLNVQSLSDDAGIDRRTVETWINALELGYLIYRLRPFHKNFNKRLNKQPKLYFWDTGLLCYLLRLSDADQLETLHLRGAIFETLIVAEARKHDFNRAARANFYFWREHHGHEIDLLIERGLQIDAVEIKASQTLTGDHFAGLRYWQSLTACENERLHLIYAGDTPQTRHGMRAVPWRASANLG